MTTTSNLTRFRPRPAAVASASSSQQYKQAQARAAQNIAVRRRLPRTQQDLYAQRLSQR